VGPDYASVFNGSFTAQMAEDGTFDLVFDLAPFDYDPAAGDLLLEVLVNTPTIPSARTLHFEFDFLLPDTSRVFQVPGTGVNVQNHGLLTRFTITTVPEPGSGSLVAAGLLVLLAVLFLSRKSSKQRVSRIEDRPGQTPPNLLLS
jgi:hypothetical protein